MKGIFLALGRVLRAPGQVALFLALSLAFFIFVVWIQNRTVVAEIITGADSAGDAIRLLAVVAWQHIDLAYIQNTFFILAALLFGVNVTVFIYYIRRARKGGGVVATTSFFGTIAALFGVGCAACGSVILTTLLGTTAATGIVGVLPWEGLELALLGILLLLISIGYLAKKISDPLICPVEPR